MNYKNLLLSSAALIGILCTSQDAFANEIEPDSQTVIKDTYEVEDFYSKVKIYDEKDNLIHYTKDELKQIITLTPNDHSSIESKSIIAPMSMKTTYDYGPMTFDYAFYVGPGSNGKAFFNPADTLIKVNGTASSFNIIAYNDTGTGSGTKAKTIEIPGGWTGTIHVSEWTNLPRGKSYRFKIENTGSKFTINNIQVWYNWQG